MPPRLNAPHLYLPCLKNTKIPIATGTQSSTRDGKKATHFVNAFQSSSQTSFNFSEKNRTDLIIGKTAVTDQPIQTAPTHLG